MKKNNVKIKDCQHVQIEGVAFYDERKYFMFAPDISVPHSTPRFRLQGVAQQMSDGTFDFVAKPRVRANSTLIKKLAHGRASVTRDGAVQVTLKIMCNEGINISETILREAQEASEAIMEYQLKR